MNPLELWRAWRLYGKVQNMDSTALKKLAVAAVAAAVAAGSAQYLASDSVNVSAVISAVVTTVIAYVQKSPTK